MRTPLRPLLPLVASLCVLVSALVAPAVIGLCAASAANPSAAGWGNNAEGELGNGLGRYASAPGAVSQGARGASDPYTQISMGVGDFWSGGTNACGVTSAGSAYCWGSGTNGRLGSGSTANSVIPVAVARGARAADDTFVSVSVGKTSACGLTGRGAAFCWGMNASGQLGNGTLVDDSAPVAVTGGLTFKHVDVGGDAACGVATDDSVYCWGSNTSGQMARVAAR